MDVKEMRSFLRVARFGNLTRAAESLDIPQPTLSRTIKEIEKETGAVLFVRTRRGVHLSDAGRRFAERIQGIVGQIDDAMAEAGGDNIPAGYVTVGIPHSMTAFIAHPLVEWFARSFPGSVISAQQGVSDEIEQGIALGQIDVGILISAQTLAPLAGLKPFATEQAYLNVAPGRQLSKSVVDWPDLADLPLILPRRQNQLRRRIEAAAHRHRYKLNVVAEISSPQLIVSLTAAGLGCSVMPACASEQARADGRVVGYPIVNTEVVWTIAKSQQSPASKLARLIEDKILDLAAKRAERKLWRLLA